MKFKLLIIGVLTLAIISSCEKDDTMSTDPTNTDPTTITLEYPSTYIVVGADTMWMVSKNQNYDPNKYRYQLNFGTKAQLQQNVDEVGQNSTVGFTISFSEKPQSSGNFNFTSSRFNIDNTQVNIYLSFFNNTGYYIVNKNYLSPDEGEFNVSISGANFSAAIESLVLSDEADATQKLNFKCSFDFEW